MDDLETLARREARHHDARLADLLLELNRMGLGPDRISHDDLLELRSAHAIGEHVREVADKLLEAREAEVGPDAWATIERFVLLRMIDTLWVEHLTELDDMRRGIGLRGYSQQDPLNEFKKEAYGLYAELSGFIRHQVASTIFRVQIQQQAQQAQGVFQMQGPGMPGAGGRRQPVGVGAGPGAVRRPGSSGFAGPGVSGTSGAARGVAATGAAGGPAGAAGQQARPGYTPTGAKIGRNDACWCGSGLKYKKCHGR